MEHLLLNWAALATTQMAQVLQHLAAQLIIQMEHLLLNWEILVITQMVEVQPLSAAARTIHLDLPLPELIASEPLAASE